MLEHKAPLYPHICTFIAKGAASLDPRAAIRLNRQFRGKHMVRIAVLAESSLDDNYRDGLTHRHRVCVIEQRSSKADS
jgi:hypothetical protein